MPRLQHAAGLVRALVLLALVAMCCGTPRPLLAQDRWLFVPVFTAQQTQHPTLAQLSTPLESEMRAQDQSVTSNGDAAMLFETRHSAEPVQLDSDELSRLLKSVGLATRHLALGELPQAQQAMEGVYALSGPARDYLNREAVRARKIFDTCLMTAYLWEREQKHQEALHQMIECSRNFPGFRPEGRAYPPELRAVFERAKQQLSQQPMTTLLVESRSNAGCGVRLNGIEVGKSPTHFSDVRAGVMRVQLECEPGVAGRIHAVELRPGENRLDIDAAFDAVVHTKAALWLEYENDAARNARMDADLLQIQKALGTQHVVGLVIDGGSSPRVHVRSLTGPPHDVASLAFSVDGGRGYGEHAVAEVIRELVPKAAALETRRDGGRGRDNDTGRSQVELTGPQETFATDAEQTPLRQAPVVQQQQVLLGVLLAAAGVGGLTTSWVFYGLRHQWRVDTNIQLNVDDTTGEYSVPPYGWRPPDAGTLALVTASSLVLSLSDYFWLPDAEGIPTWAWVAGGIGTAVAITGIALAALSPGCLQVVDDSPDPACNEFARDDVFGPMVALHALPFLSVPLSYAIRGWLGPNTEQVALSVETPSGGGALLRLRGAF